MPSLLAFVACESNLTRGVYFVTYLVALKMVLISIVSLSLSLKISVLRFQDLRGGCWGREVAVFT